MSLTMKPRTNTGFLDLPAELRNAIYAYALYHHRRDQRLAVVSLLRTCRQVHDEAESFLYIDSTWSIAVHCTIQLAPSQEQYWMMAFRGDSNWRGSRQIVSQHSLLYYEAAWPRSIGRISKIELNFSYVGWPHMQDDGTRQAVHQILYSLASALQSASNLGTRQVEIYYSTPTRGPLADAAMLYPLAKLPASIEIILRMPFQLSIKLLLEDLRSCKHPVGSSFDVLSRYRILRSKILPYLPEDLNDAYTKDKQSSMLGTLEIYQGPWNFVLARWNTVQLYFERSRHLTTVDTDRTIMADILALEAWIDVCSSGEQISLEQANDLWHDWSSQCYVAD